MPNIIGYARVSTRDQNPQLQLDALTAAGAARIFTDTATGTNINRPQLTAALEYLNPGDVLVVWKLDRLGRSVRDCIGLLEGLHGRGIEFRSLTQGFDTTTAQGKFFYTVMSAFAELDVELLRERTHEGLAAARRQGRVGGRPTVMTPERTADAVRKYNEGVRISQIAAVLGVGRASVRRALERALDTETGSDTDTDSQDTPDIQEESGIRAGAQADKTKTKATSTKAQTSTRKQTPR
ncbi:DNA invertase Pin-like site-specific DNA recombinase [Arthrobacter sp. CAN_A2]|uniref:recombinase family protein n=1 Tax=Arthrobacter sp. CAN_A2 TaxID=2787718 RepID=UPI0018F00B3D